jgi:hypothetical protein
MPDALNAPHLSDRPILPPICLQGRPVLLLADSRAFFTLYKVVSDAGLRAYQLDRDGRLGLGLGQGQGQGVANCGAAAHEIQEAVEQALRCANCILANNRQLATMAGFLDRFTCMVEYCALGAAASPELEGRVSGCHSALWSCHAAAAMSWW